MPECPWAPPDWDWGTQAWWVARPGGPSCRTAEGAIGLDRNFTAVAQPLDPPAAAGAPEEEP